MFFSCLRAVAAAAAFLFAPLAFAAAQFNAHPLLLSLPAGKLSTAVTLGNGGSKPVTVQAELVRWTQENGLDVYTPLTGLIVSPPIFSVDGGASQVVRLGRMERMEPPAQELAYRLRLLEVPDATASREGAVATVMQLSLPVFTAPADLKATPQLSASVLRDAEGGLRLRLHNQGAVHDKLVSLRLLRGDTVLAERAYNFYVLAGARRELRWAEALAGDPTGALELVLQLDGRKRELRLPLPSP